MTAWIEAAEPLPDGRTGGAFGALCNRSCLDVSEVNAPGLVWRVRIAATGECRHAALIPVRRLKVKPLRLGCNYIAVLNLWAGRFGNLNGSA